MFTGLAVRKVRRFYKEVAYRKEEEGNLLLLDSRPIKTPAGHKLFVPTPALAEAIAAEWRAQGEEVLPETMPLSQLAITGIDRVAKERTALIFEVMKFAHTDLLCYRADGQSDLAARQEMHWGGLLEWAALALDAPLTATRGITHIQQPEASLLALGKHVEALSVDRLTGVQSLTAATGSLIIALAVAHGKLSGDEAYKLSQLDEDYQIEQWGEDPVAAKRRAALKRDIEAAARYLELLA
jgi:chaperone required for assembly of F1-ATPase